MTPSTGADSVDEDADDDDDEADAEPERERDADDEEAGRGAGGAGGPLDEEGRLEGRLDGSGSGGDGLALGTRPHSTARLQASSCTLDATATSRLKDLGRAARTGKIRRSRARAAATERPPGRERRKRVMTYKTVRSDPAKEKKGATASESERTSGTR